MSIGVREEASNGSVAYECEIDSIEEDKAERLSKWLKAVGIGTLSGGIVGGSLSNGTGLGLGVSIPSSSGGVGPKGDKGDAGLNFLAAWSDLVDYLVDDVVTYSGETWIAIAPSTNVTPVEGPSWTLLAAQGSVGPAGPSAFAVAVAEGFVGTESEWLAALVGDTGAPGDSAFDVAVANGFVGTEEEWLTSLTGADGIGVPDPSGEADGQMLSVASGALVYGDPPAGGGGSGAVRDNVVHATASLASYAAEDAALDLGTSSLLWRLQSDVSCRIRLYATAAARTADASRAVDVFPDGNHGCYVDVTIDITDSATLMIIPIVALTTVDGFVYAAIENLSAGTSVVTVTIDTLVLEA
jgi:hypothetical protein